MRLLENALLLFSKDGGGQISLRKGTELMDEEEENIEKLPTFKHTIDVPELLKGSSSRKDN